MVRLTIDARRPDPAAVAEAAAVIAASGLVVAPTDTLYGLAANPFDRAAVARVFAAKGRGGDQALPLVAADLAQVTTAIGALPPVGARLAQHYWPGPLTLLMPAPPTLALAVSGGTGRVGLRVPDHAVMRALCAACGFPLTATSANRSGLPPTADPTTIDETLASAVDVLLDAGPTPGGPPSTILDVSGAEPVLVRPGAIAWKEILAWLHDDQRAANGRRSSD